MDQKRKYNFYFAYTPYTFKNTLQALNNGKIRKSRYYSETEPFDLQIFEEIVGYAYFDDLILKNTNYKPYQKFQFIIHPKILEKHNVEFRIQRGFGRGFIMTPSDPNEILQDKLQLAKDMGSGGDYEIVFDKPIDIAKYIPTIICNDCTNKEYEQIKRVIIDKKYNIKLIRIIRDGNKKKTTTNVFLSSKIIN